MRRALIGIGTKKRCRLSDIHIPAGLDHSSSPAAVLRGVAQPNKRQAVEQDVRAACDGFPCIGSAALGVPALVAEAQGWTAIDEDVGGAACGRTLDAMGAAFVPVRVAGAVGFVSESASQGHGGLLEVWYFVLGFALPPLFGGIIAGQEAAHRDRA